MTDTEEGKLSRLWLDVVILGHLVLLSWAVCLGQYTLSFVTEASLCILVSGSAVF